MTDYMPKYKNCVVAVSFLNYQTSIGGMSKYMMAHRKMYSDAEYSYISIYSVKKLVKNRYPLFHFYGLIIDDKNCGIMTIDELLKYFDYLIKNAYSINDVHIHNISYMNTDHLIRMAEALYDVEYKLILHDFHTVCTNFNLLKNGVAYCGDGKRSPEKCKDCIYYLSGQKFIDGVRKLLNIVKDRLTVVAPSESAKRIWLESYPEYEKCVTVITEQLWRGEYLENKEPLKIGDKITVGYLGNKSRHKGWNQWLKFIDVAYNDNSCYQFMVFNSKCDFDTEKMAHYPVCFQPDDLNPMITALRKNKIVCVLLWSIWPETYSYTLFEAISANVFIITNINSGNIAEVVSKSGNGLVLETENELYDYAANPRKLIEKINYARKNSVPGPFELIDNSEFLKLTDKNKQSHILWTPRGVIYRAGQKCLLKTVLLISKILKIKL